jgi:hypothetical protein
MPLVTRPRLSRWKLRWRTVNKTMESMTLLRVKVAIWYEYLTGRLGYDAACDLYEALLPATNALKQEAK